MLSPTAMKHVRLLVLAEDLPTASLALAETGLFHPDARDPDEARLDTAPARDYRRHHERARQRLDKLAELLDLALPQHIDQPRVIEPESLAALDHWLGELWQTASAHAEGLRQLDDEARLVAEHQAALANFAALDIDLAVLRNNTRFLDIHVGMVPRENLARLGGALGLAHYLVHVYMQRGDQTHVVIVGPSDAAPESLPQVLAAAGFQALPIPVELDREPARVRQQLETRSADIARRRAALERELAEWGADHRAQLLAAQQTLLLAAPLVALDPALRASGPLAHLAGWVPASAVEALEQRLRETLPHPFALSARDPRADERRLVPTVITRNRLLAPFATLVGQYGIPEYGEVDPTPLFAVTFLLMFGSMFGDLGQGAVIALAAWLLRRRLGRFWPFGLLAGLSSMAFGLVFGSVFGNEHLIPALWMSPLTDPLRMLTLALLWGVGFITLACTLAIYNRVAVGRWRDAVLGHHGAVNLVFYLALVGAGVGLAEDGALAPWPATIAGLALATLTWASWREQQGPLIERALVVFIATLETVIGYVSNTLSFLRVAAFGLNHVALAIAVYTLAGMLGEVGHLVTLVLGNLFIIVLEGGIVMIQVMRLQYYEGFSRYFSGDGHAFAPLRLPRD